MDLKPTKCFGMVVLALALFLAGACGKGEAPKVDPRLAQANAVKAQADDLQAGAEALRAQIDQSKADLARMNNRLNEMQAAADAMKAKSAEMQHGIDVLIRTPSAEAGSTGWMPWYVKAFFIVVVIVVIYLFYKALTRGGGDGDEEAVDESFVEESDLGSVRYPGTKPEETTKG